MKKKCSNCVHCLTIGIGYSNYTVEGIDVICNKGLNPEAPFDRWYGGDKKDLFAEQCPSHHYGDGVEIDVDHDAKINSNDLEVRWKNYSTEHISGNDIQKHL